MITHTHTLASAMLICRQGLMDEGLSVKEREREKEKEKERERERERNKTMTTTQ